MPLFDPTEFFLNTAHFASAGRGLFTLNRLPGMFQNSSTVPEPVSRAFVTLMRGHAARTASLPARQLSTWGPASFNGPTRKHAYMQTFADIDVEFLVMGRTASHARELYYGLSYWQEAIAGPIDRARFARPANPGVPRSDTDAFGAAYYDDYVSDATVSIYGPSMRPDGDPLEIIRVDLFDVYPISIGQVQTSWDNADTPIALPVTFTFFYAQTRLPA